MLSYIVNILQQLCFKRQKSNQNDLTFLQFLLNKNKKLNIHHVIEERHIINVLLITKLPNLLLTINLISHQLIINLIVRIINHLKMIRKEKLTMYKKLNYKILNLSKKYLSLHLLLKKLQMIPKNILLFMNILRMNPKKIMKLNIL